MSDLDLSRKSARDRAPDASAAGPRAPGTEVATTVCWLCGAAILERHCKIVCKNCGFTRDCSDP